MRKYDKERRLDIYSRIDAVNIPSNFVGIFHDGYDMLKNGNSTRVYHKPWGFEIWFAENDKYAGKILHIKRGEKLSLQYHKKKHETLYIYQGKCNITINEDTMIANPGECFEIPPGTIHRIEAIHDSIIFEVSTSELDDVVRLEDDYGRVPESDMS